MRRLWMRFRSGSIRREWWCRGRRMRCKVSGPWSVFFGGDSLASCGELTREAVLKQMKKTLR